jgi:hypothetical protein
VLLRGQPPAGVSRYNWDQEHPGSQHPVRFPVELTETHGE